MIKYFSPIFLSIILLISCGPSEREQAQQEQREQQLQMQMIETTPEFNNQMETLLSHYFELKDAFIQSDADAASSAAQLFLTNTEEVDSSGLTQESATVWSSFSQTLVENTSNLIPLDDVDEQRYYFEHISEAMINLVETFEPLGYQVYHQSCPMVRDGSADWLSREEEIKNPYHGERMMNCGETIRQL